MTDGNRERVERLRSRSPGDDPDDPYADVDVSALPEWWRRAIEEFDSHDLRPYRPPRFDDGTLTPPVLDSLEDALDVEIAFGSVGADYRTRWEVSVDGEVVMDVGRHRSPNGYTVYEMDAEEFWNLIAAHVADDRR